jgi:hypothetical protein
MVGIHLVQQRGSAFQSAYIVVLLVILAASTNFLLPALLLLQWPQYCLLVLLGHTDTCNNIVLTPIVCKLLPVVLLILCCWMLEAHRLCCFAATDGGWTTWHCQFGSVGALHYADASDFTGLCFALDKLRQVLVVVMPTCCSFL